MEKIFFNKNIGFYRGITAYNDWGTSIVLQVPRNSINLAEKG